MRIADCEVQHRVIRGHKVAFIFGSRALSGAELAGLASEWVQTYGPVALPGYASPDGWQAMGLPAGDADEPAHPAKARGKRGAKES